MDNTMRAAETVMWLSVVFGGLGGFLWLMLFFWMAQSLDKIAKSVDRWSRK